MATIGIDVGGSKAAAVLLDETGAVIGSEWREHASDQFGVVDVVVALVEELSRSEHVDRVGVSLAAWLTPDRVGVLIGANLGLEATPLQARLVELLGVPVVLENDGNATAYAEYTRGAGSGSRMLVSLALGTGVGGGIVADGRLLTGANGFGAELGHLQVETDGPACVCGGFGCLELYASGRAVAAAAGRPTRQVVAAARDGDSEARGALAGAGRAIGRALGRIVAVVDPDAVLLSGSLAESASELILEPAQAELARCLPLSAVLRPVAIRLGSCGRDAAALGAAELARAAVISSGGEVTEQRGDTNE
jgi:glucokinase